MAAGALGTSPRVRFLLSFGVRGQAPDAQKDFHPERPEPSKQHIWGFTILGVPDWGPYYEGILRVGGLYCGSPTSGENFQQRAQPRSLQLVLDLQLKAAAVGLGLWGLEA